MPDPGSPAVWSHALDSQQDMEDDKQRIIMLRSRLSSSSGTLLGAATPKIPKFGDSISAEVRRSRRTSRIPSPDIAVSKPLRSRYPPLSLSRYVGTPRSARNDSAMSAIQTFESMYQASDQSEEYHSYSREDTRGSTELAAYSDKGSADVEPIAASVPNVRKLSSRQGIHSLDLDPMHGHRTSQAAELDQEMPHVRKSGFNGESTTFVTVERSVQLLCLDDYITREQPSVPNEGLHSPYTNSSPQIPISPTKSLHPALRRISLPDVTPFHEFCQTAPTLPLHSLSKQSRIKHEECPQLHRKSHESCSSTSSSTSDTAPLAEPPAPSAQLPLTGQDQFTPTYRSFEHRPTTVIRGLGSGFEILAPGSLNPPRPAETAAEKRTSRPPPSMLNNPPRLRSSSIDGQRKLQKRRRASVDSPVSPYGR